MTDEQPVSTEITGYTLAIDDLWTVLHVALLIAEHDPDLWFAQRVSEVGIDAAAAEGASRPISPMVPADFEARRVLETGLVVTYARPFTTGRGLGFPLPRPSYPKTSENSIGFASWTFRKERGADLARIPADLKRLLLEHSLASADDDKRSRALAAFAG